MQCEMISGAKVIVKQSDIVLHLLNVQTHDGFTRVEENLDVDRASPKKGDLGTAVYTGTARGDDTGHGTGQGW